MNLHILNLATRQFQNATQTLAPCGLSRTSPGENAETTEKETKELRNQAINLRISAFTLAPDLLSKSCVWCSAGVSVQKPKCQVTRKPLGSDILIIHTKSYAAIFC
jgi:hypothetical protein